jgi:DNA-binding NtrC family response regulator
MHGDALLLTEMVGDCGGACELKTTDRLGSALKLLDEEDFALVITDLNLPDSTGAGLVRSIKERSLGVPVIVLSGTYDESSIAEAMNVGATACFRKGITEIDALNVTILRLLEKSQTSPRVAIRM